MSVALRRPLDRSETGTNAMPTYLFTWNPLSPFSWPNNAINSATTRKGKIVRIRWSTGHTDCIVAGDRIFLAKQGQPPLGVIASGVAAMDCFEDTDWEDASRSNIYTMVDFDTILEPESVLPRASLAEGPLAEVNWETEYGGITIAENAAEALETMWRDWVALAGFPRIDPELEQSAFQLSGHAGWTQLRLHLFLERDSTLLQAKRAEVLRRHGRLDCEVCGTEDAEAMEYHDRRALSTLDSTGILDTTLDDVALVCAPCHGTLHSQDWPSVEKLRSRLVPRPA